MTRNEISEQKKKNGFYFVYFTHTRAVRTKYIETVRNVRKH